MMRKKYVQNDLIKARDKHNERVTVQYIHNPQIYQKPDNSYNDLSTVHPPAQDLEIENVEYLEDNTNVEEYAEEPCEKEVDNFYPNAICCLLDLYKIKYESLTSQNEDIKAAQLWNDIAKEMQESFFEFDEFQVQQKYASLRRIYFAIQTKEDIENFDYFEQLHDIYKDLSKENIAKGLKDDKVNSGYYKDDIFIQMENIESNGRQTHDFKSEEIVHKEHEFIDMVEKELQAMEDRGQNESKEISEVLVLHSVSKQEIASNNLENLETSIEKHLQNTKRFRSDNEFSEEQSQKKPKLNERVGIGLNQETCNSTTKTEEKFTLYLYNKEQERRHREKMMVLEKSLKIQERYLEQQQQLLETLIKLFPS